MTPSLGIEPGPHWWEASALTPASTLLSSPPCSPLLPNYSYNYNCAGFPALLILPVNRSGFSWPVIGLALPKAAGWKAGLFYGPIAARNILVILRHGISNTSLQRSIDYMSISPNFLTTKSKPSTRDSRSLRPSGCPAQPLGRNC